MYNNIIQEKMYLSRVKIDKTRRSYYKFLSSAQVMHATIESCFDKEDNSRKLWRLDHFKNEYYILILSENEPNLQVISKQYGFEQLEGNEETRDYKKVLEVLKNGQFWRFRLRANPVRSVKNFEGNVMERGKVLSHVTVNYQKKWLSDRAEKLGFEIKEFDIIQRDIKKFKRQNSTVTIGMVTYEGILEIRDIEIFKDSLIRGIGKAKAYGCGLLTLARVQ